jgi:hypothetical protein
VLREGGVEDIMDWVGVISTYIWSVILSSCIVMLLEYRSCVMKRSVANLEDSSM